MKVEIQLSKEAEKDLLDSFSWYQSAREGLGDEFLEVLEFSLNAISENPKAYSIQKAGQGIPDGQIPFFDFICTERRFC